MDRLTERLMDALMENRMPVSHLAKAGATIRPSGGNHSLMTALACMNAEKSQGIK